MGTGRVTPSGSATGSRLYGVIKIRAYCCVGQIIVHRIKSAITRLFLGAVVF